MKAVKISTLLEDEALTIWLRQEQQGDDKVAREKSLRSYRSPNEIAIWNVLSVGKHDTIVQA